MSDRAARQWHAEFHARRENSAEFEPVASRTEDAVIQMAEDVRRIRLAVQAVVWAVLLALAVLVLMTILS